jgi:histidinol-phosphate aminotransferase
VDRLTQVAGLAALAAYDQAMAANQDTAVRRDRIAETLTRRYGWKVWPSATNFILADTSPRPASEVYERLKARRVLVRYFGKPRLENCLRITIGAEEAMEAFLQALHDSEVQDQQKLRMD